MTDLARGKHNRLLITILVLALVISGIGTGLAWFRATANENIPNFELSEIPTLIQVIGLVRTSYVDPVSVSDLVTAYVKHGTLNGMLQGALHDPYTRYLDPHAYNEMQLDTTGVFGGIGIYVGIRDDTITVIAPIPGTPGYSAGLQAGDVILAIDGQSTAEMSLDEAVSLMRGEKGDAVELKVARGQENGQVEHAFRIERDVIHAPAVSKVAMTDKHIGYVRILHFSLPVVEEVRQAYKDLKSQGMRGLVIDLRFNPGGLFTAAIGLSDLFLSRGPIVHVEERGDRKQTFTATAGTLPRVPIVILQNEYSASASEIFAGALQDAGVATLVGTHSFGKGLVQTVVPIRGGAALSLTTARYLTRAGRDIHHEGIAPDVKVVVENPVEDLQGLGESELNLQDPQLKRALELLAAQTSGAVRLQAARSRASVREVVPLPVAS